ncbi:MAG TPA: alanine racemase [Methylomirabilota bacterium]|nr:alanine racemase [Methylomirabilota bacterium]
MSIKYRCWAEVDLAALRENLAWLRHRIGPGVKILTVVKADAYGHGLKQIAACLMRSGTDIFGVANLAEAQSLRAVGPGWPVLMLGACLPHEIEAAVRDDIRPTVSSLAEAHAFARVARRRGRTVSVHLKVDTGMGRLGAPVASAVELAGRIRALPSLRLEGIYTHFASAEDDPAFTALQLRRFANVLTAVRKAGLEVPLVHASNSAALLYEREARFNLVRPGLLVYGVMPPGRRRPPRDLANRLRPALSWKARVCLIKEIGPGDSLSYGRMFTASRRMKVATVSAGYGDGYLRAAGGRAQVLVGGRRCAVLGRITMDQMLVDVSRVPRVAVGDEVVLIGRQGGQSISATTLAGWAGSIPWEVLTSITYRVPRLYRGESAA